MSHEPQRTWTSVVPVVPPQRTWTSVVPVAQSSQPVSCPSGDCGVGELLAPFARGQSIGLAEQRGEMAFGHARMFCQFVLYELRLMDGMPSMPSPSGERISCSLVMSAFDVRAFRECFFHVRIIPQKNGFMICVVIKTNFHRLLKLTY